MSVRRVDEYWYSTLLYSWCPHFLTPRRIDGQAEPNRSRVSRASFHSCHQKMTVELNLMKNESHTNETKQNEATTPTYCILTVVLQLHTSIPPIDLTRPSSNTPNSHPLHILEIGYKVSRSESLRNHPSTSTCATKKHPSSVELSRRLIPIDTIPPSRQSIECDFEL